MSNQCQVLPCAPLNLYSYSIEGTLPQPQPIVPSDFYNEQVVAIVCEEGDTPSFSGVLPGWIQFLAEDRQFVGSPGVWGADSQSQANALAQSELDAFVTANEDEIHCSGQLLFEWQSTVVQGDGTASFTPIDFATGDSIDGQSQVDDPAPGTAAAFFIATGTITWNSTETVAVNLHIESVAVINGDVGIQWITNVDVTAPAPVGLAGTDSGTVGLNSITDIPFFLPDTGGVNWTIVWSIAGSVEANPTNGGSLDLTATLEIV